MLKKMLGVFLVFSVILTMAAGDFAFIFAKTEEVNIAPDAEVEVEDEDKLYGGVKEHINDGDDSTYWSYPNNQWPTSICLKLAQISSVNKVVVKLGSADWADKVAVDVEIKYARNGITSDLQTFGVKKTAQTLGSDIVFESDIPVDASHVYVELSNPQRVSGYDGDVTLWPTVREVEVYEEREEQLSKYNNIVGQATISTNGSNPNDSSYLTDGNVSTLYKFHNGPLTVEKYIDLVFDEARSIDAFEITFENVGNSDPYNYNFEYSILGKNGNGEFVTLVNHQTADRVENFYKSYKVEESQFTNIRIVMHSTTTINNGVTGIGWPAIAEFAIYGDEKKVVDNESIAFGKPVHSNSNRTTMSNVNDGNINTSWKGNMYPGYADIDLEKNYYLDEIEVYTPDIGYSQYSIYTSMDGRDFDLVAKKTSKDSCPIDGEKYAVNNKEARYVRVYVEYNSSSSQAVINEVRVKGTESGTDVLQRPEINVQSYDQSSYATASITDQDAYNEVYGIIERRLGEKYENWFTLEVANNPKGHEYDYFELSNSNGKIHIKGNNGVSLATGLNHYLKYYCNVNISQVGDQVTMPENIVTLDNNVFKETKAKVRYAYNYCTLSYSMPFYGEEEWRNELDWLALNGVNVVLDATAQEEVWRRFLGKLGYEHEDIKDFIAGPAYYAWAYMANLSGFGGPVHDSWFEERTELARKNQLAMQRLGMQPVLQGYSGMVPNDLAEHDASVESDIIKQGTWCSFQRPDMLETNTDTYKKYADLFYQAQHEVYGDATQYYATDPFHEGGNTGGMSPTVIAEKVLDSLLEFDNDAIWIIQSWQGNPTNALLNGIDGREEHALILDLYAEKSPNNQSYGDTPEFDGKPWVFCMLNNFGGRLGLHGHLDNLANNIPEVFNNREYVEGIGITPEASVNNPLLYDFLFETVWADDATKNLEVIDLNDWLAKYQVRRYGSDSQSATEALKILKDTVYKAEYNMKGQGAPESVVNSRPAFDINAASTWGNAVIDYDKTELERAASLMMEDYDKLKDSEGYRYDLATILEQVLSNSAQEYLKKMKSAYTSGSVEKFEAACADFMEIIDNMEKVTSTSKYYLLGTWVNQAKDLAKNADDFSKALYEMNAKSLVTTWGSINQAESGGLHDYSNRQWSGLINDFYKVRWEIWIENKTKELKGESTNYPNWFEWEWSWARGNAEFTSTPSDINLNTVGNQILEKFSVKNPANDSSNDVDVSTISVVAGNYENSSAAQSYGEGGPEYVLDNRLDTKWHTVYGGSPREEHYLEFTLNSEQEISGLRYLPRRDGGKNGLITKYQILVKNSDSDNWQTVVKNGVLDETNLDWQILKFDNDKTVKAKQVKFVVVDALSSEPGNLYASLTEMRILKGSVKVDLSELKELVDLAGDYIKEDYTTDSWYVFTQALNKAIEILKQENVTQNQINDAVDELQNAIDNLELKIVDINKAALSIAVEMAEAVTQEQLDKVVPAVANEFKAALENAQNVFDNTKATQEEVDNAFDRLAKVMQMLEFYKGDKAALQKMMDQIANLTASDYTDSTWNALQAVLPSVDEVLGNVNAMQDEVDQVYSELVKAFVNLRLKPNKDILNNLINQANRLNRANYTAASWSILEPELAKANSVLNDPEATEVEVTNAVNGLTKAIAGLVENNPVVDNNVEIPAAVKSGDTTVNATKTGDAVSIMYPLVGLVIATLGVYGSKKRRKDN